MVKVNGMYVSRTKIGRLDKLLVMMSNGLTKTVTTPDMEIDSELGKGMCVIGNYLVVGEPSISKTNGRVLVVNTKHNIDMQSLSKAYVLEPKISSKTLKGFGSSIVYYNDKLYILSNGKSLLKDVNSTIHEYDFKAGIPRHIKTHKLKVKVKQLLIIDSKLCVDIGNYYNPTNKNDFKDLDVEVLGLDSDPINGVLVLPNEPVEFCSSSVIYNFIYNKNEDDYEYNKIGIIDTLVPPADAMYDDVENVCVYSIGDSIHKCKLIKEDVEHEC